MPKVISQGNDDVIKLGSLALPRKIQTISVLLVTKNPSPPFTLVYII